MFKLTINMPDVSFCSASECAYNSENLCHARAITVGDGIVANCDTFCQASSHVTNIKSKAGVGACKVSSCQFNEDLECSTKSIRVGQKESGVECLTFQPA